VETVVRIFLIIASLILIASILLQSGKEAGIGEIAGGAESIWGKNKGKSYEGKLEKATAISAIVFLIASLLLVAIQ
jgi:preprotein translocase subunit SecG